MPRPHCESPKARQSWMGRLHPEGHSWRRKAEEEAAVQGSHTSPDSIAAVSESLSVKQELGDTACQCQQHLLQHGRRLLLGKPDGSESKSAINCTVKTVKSGINSSAFSERPLDSSESSYGGCTFPR